MEEQKVIEFLCKNKNRSLASVISTKYYCKDKYIKDFVADIKDEKLRKFFVTDKCILKFIYNTKQNGIMFNNDPEEFYRKTFSDDNPYIKKNIELINKHPRQFHHVNNLSYIKQLKSLNESIPIFSTKPWETIFINNIKISINRAIKICSHEYNVKMYIAWSIYGWWNNYHKIYIYKDNKYLATTWVYKGDILSHRTIPISDTDTVVYSPYNVHNLLFELTHAIQHAMVLPWNLNKKTMNIAARLIVRKYNGQPHPYILKKHISLAIADILSIDYKDFNRIYAEESGLEDVGNVAARSSYYFLYPREYVNFILGMIIPIPDDLSTVLII